MKNNNKGFTLVEVTVCIALLAIVITPIGLLINQQTKTAKAKKNDATVQQNVQLVMSAFRTKCIPASSVTSITDSGGSDAHDTDTENLAFSKLVINNVHTGETTTYEYDTSSKTLMYNNTFVADNVEVLVSPLPEASTYANCKGIRVKVVSSLTDDSIKKSHSADIENQFYFRNAT